MNSKSELRSKLKEILREKFSGANTSIEISAEASQVRKSLLSLPEFAGSKTILAYINMTREFPTIPYLHDILFHNDNNTLAVPWCDGDDLKVFRLASSKECQSDSPEMSVSRFQSLFAERLAPGSFGILEPKMNLRTLPDYQISDSEIDLVIVPGLGFDSQCRRLGRGRGYYDRFLKRLRPCVPLIGLAFDEQIVEEVPTEQHDWQVDAVVTPTRIFVSNQKRKDLK